MSKFIKRIVEFHRPVARLYGVIILGEFLGFILAGFWAFGYETVTIILMTMGLTLIYFKK